MEKNKENKSQNSLECEKILESRLSIGKTNMEAMKKGS